MRSGPLTLLVWLALILMPVASRGEVAPAPATPEGLLSFGKALLDGGDSFRAATEFLRFLHHFPEHPSAPAALRGLGASYAQAARWEEAAQTYRRLAELTPGPQVSLLLGAALYRGGHYPEAAEELLRSGGAPPGTDSTASILATLALLRGGAEAIPPALRPDLAAQFRDLPRKSPATAAVLAAALPGAGHLYVGRPRDATLAFLLNAAFLWGTVAAARNEQWALAGILGAFELGWYGGNVVSAMNAAHQWNRREEAAFFSRWEARALPSFSVAPTPLGLGGMLAWHW